MQYIIIIGAFQAVLALWLLMIREKKDLSSSLLILLLSAIAVHLAIKFIIYRFISDESIRLQMNTFITVCYGPLIYLYTLAKTKNAFSLAHKWFIFLPFFVLMLAYFTVSCVFLILARVDQHLLNLYNYLSLYLVFIINVCYSFKSIFIAKKNNKILSEIEYRVIIRISCCVLFIESFVPISKILQLIFPEDSVLINIILRSLAYSTLLFICLLIIIKNFKIQNVNLQEMILQPKTEAGDSNLKENVSLNTIDYESKFNELWQKLDESVRTKQLFRDCDLTLDQLALKTKVNKYQISEMLNAYKNKSFYQYINEYRIDYFKSKIDKAIETNENVYFLSLAYEAGFKSKSSFNRYFKDITGKTPSEYYRLCTRTREYGID